MNLVTKGYHNDHYIFIFFQEINKNRLNYLHVLLRFAAQFTNGGGGGHLIGTIGAYGVS